MNHPDEAESLLKSGLNCCQAMLMAYAAEHGLTREDAMRIGSGFGGGMGGMGGMGLTCGAVTGAYMVIGLKYPRPDREHGAESSRRVQAFSQRFCRAHGTCACRELLGYDISTPEGNAAAREAGAFQRVCPKLVRSAAEILDQVL